MRSFNRSSFILDRSEFLTILSLLKVRSSLATDTGAVKLNSHWPRHGAARHDADQIWFPLIAAMRTQSVFSAMRHDASKLNKFNFDAR